MLGGISPLSNVLGSAPPADAETARLRNYAKTAASIGLHMLLIEPGGKAPVDMRSSVQRRTEDTAAQALAREAARPDWARVRSRAGVHLATDDAKLLARYLDRYRKTCESDHDVVHVNMAVAVGPSRLIVVDCDTEEQVTAFLADAGIPADTPLPPTVRSPGQRDAQGNWVHYGGGHYYFTLPEDLELPKGTGSLTMPGGYAILWDGRYVLIPPSVRAEGAYYLTGQDYPAPQWIIERITAHAAGRTHRRQEFGTELGELSTNIDAWAAMVPWEDLLEPAGWALAARPDGCGCQVWTAPGTHASPKSATAHDTGCTYDRYSDINAPLHIWTDNPGDELSAWINAHGSQTITKLQLTAALNYGGDVGTACSELGMIPRDDLGLDTDEVVRDLGLSTSNLDTPLNAVADKGTCAHGPDEMSGECHACAAMPGEAFQTLKNPAVDEALARAKTYAEQQTGQPYQWGGPDVPDFLRNPTPAEQTEFEGISFTGQPHTSPPTIPVRVGGRIPENAPAMLEAEGFQRADLKVGQMRFCSSDQDDGRTLTIDFNGEGIVTAMSVDGKAFSLITLTPLPDTSGPEDQQEHTSPPETFTNTDTPSDPPQFSDTGSDPEDGVLEAGDQFMPRIAWFDYWRDYPSPEFVVGGLIENGGMAAVIGPSGIGKSTVVLDMLGAVATGQRWHGRATMAQRVLYLPGEGLSGSIDRVKAWEKAHKAALGRDLAVGEGIVRSGAPKIVWERLVQLILQNHIGMIVFDTVARMMVGVEENSATDVGKVIARLDEVRKLTGCTVLLVHHTSKGSDSARGSSALNGALDTEILITDELWSDDPDNPPPGRQLTARTTKQKNAALIENGIPLLMVPFENSVIITGPSGEVGDVFDETIVARAVLPEPVMDTAVRIATKLEEFTQQGLTLTEMAQAVSADEWTARRADAARAWRLALRRAVDLGLRFGLLETLTGTPTGARYILSTTTRATFREQVIAAGLSE